MQSFVIFFVRSFRVEILFLIAEILFEIDAHLSFHDPQAAADDAFVVNLPDHEPRINAVKDETLMRQLIN